MHLVSEHTESIGTHPAEQPSESSPHPAETPAPNRAPNQPPNQPPNQSASQSRRTLANEAAQRAQNEDRVELVLSPEAAAAMFPRQFPGSFRMQMGWMAAFLPIVNFLIVWPALAVASGVQWIVRGGVGAWHADLPEWMASGISSAASNINANLQAIDAVLLLPALLSLPFAVLLLGGTCVLAVPTSHQVVLARFGKIVKTLKTPGVKFKFPAGLHSIHSVVLTRRRHITEHLHAITRDQNPVTLPVTIEYQIINAGLYVQAEDAIAQMQSRVQRGVRSVANRMKRDELYSGKERIRNAVLYGSADAPDAGRHAVAQDPRAWGWKERRRAQDARSPREPSVAMAVETEYGIRVIDIRVSEPQLHEEIENAMAERQRLIFEGTARTEVQRLTGIGEASRLQKVAEEIKDIATKHNIAFETVAQLYASGLHYEAVREAARNQATTVFTEGEPLHQLMAMTTKRNGARAQAKKEKEGRYSLGESGSDTGGNAAAGARKISELKPVTNTDAA